jgi:hypothetical protein
LTGTTKRVYTNPVHYETSLLYEGPPCDHCQRVMFIGTCTHRPMKKPDFKPLPFPIDDEIRALFAKLKESIEGAK